MQAHYADSFIEADYSRIQQTWRWINVSLSNEAAEEFEATDKTGNRVVWGRNSNKIILRQEGEKAKSLILHLSRDLCAPTSAHTVLSVFLKSRREIKADRRFFSRLRAEHDLSKEHSIYLTDCHL